MILLERPAGKPTSGPTRQSMNPARTTESARLIPESRAIIVSRPRAGQCQPEAERSWRSRSLQSLRPTRLYRLTQSQSEPGRAISLALPPTDQDEEPIIKQEQASPSRTSQPELGCGGDQRSSNWNAGQLLRFAVTGGLNTLVDILVLNALVWLLAVRSTPLLLACNIVAYCAGAINSFILNKYWTFGQREPITSGELWRFALITISGSLWSSGILWLAGLALQHILVNPTLWTNAAKVIAIGGTALISYLGLRLWVFVQRRPGQSVAGMHLSAGQQRCSQRGPSPAEGHGPTSVTPHAYQTLSKRKGPETL
ncbi:MAG: GtrA family protein [Thermogemmatispora sp.]|uniref:GtrA family protein n=1 Tax=Thermogemmatispora TaxID=768669 RepID=UPI00124CE1D6|nr:MULTISPECIES: GtrA family protein [Thermogemmatispora]MBE3567891.1 GtrA family protein [Thermogemmatispora sp.]